MKRKLFPIKMLKRLALMMFASVLIFSSGCNRSEDEQDKLAANAHDLIVIDKIEGFMEQMAECRNLSPNAMFDMLSVDSAVWHIEAALNYTQTRPQSRSGNALRKLTYEISLPASNQMLDLSDIQNTYDAFTDSILQAKQEAPAMDVVIADVYVKETQSQSILLALDIGINSKIPPAGNTKSWYWGGGRGYCGLGGHVSNLDAADIIQNQLTQFVYTPPVGSFWTDVECIWMRGQSDGLFELSFIDVAPGNYDYGYCVSAAEIDSYAAVIRVKTLACQPPNKLRCDIDVWDEYPVWDGGWKGRHACQIKYAKVVYGIQP